jgi:prepilin-type N-terminal cleavage/methylation domain-containing protein
MSGIDRPGDRLRGFSLIEVLIAMALAGLLIIGVLPLFTRSMSNNVEGNQTTEVTNRARLHLEELMALPIDAEELTVPDGESQRVTVEVYSASRDRWIEESQLGGAEPPLYTRTTRVRQFSNLALSHFDLELEEDEALPGGSPSSRVQLKEIVVRVNTGRPTFSSLMGRQKAVTLRVLRSV